MSPESSHCFQDSRTLQKCQRNTSLLFGIAKMMKGRVLQESQTTQGTCLRGLLSEGGGEGPRDDSEASCVVSRILSSIYAGHKLPFFSLQAYFRLDRPMNI